MKVLMVSPWQTGAGASGVASACRHLAAALTPRTGVDDVRILSLGVAPATEELPGGVRVDIVPRQRRGALLSNGWLDYRSASRWIDAGGIRPDVVHGHGFAGEGLTATRLARRLGVPSVVTVHGMVDREARLYSDALRARLTTTVMRQTLGMADAVIFVSPYRADELVLRSETLSRIIENAIGNAAFAEPAPARTPVLLYAGVIKPLKRLLDAVRALAVVRRIVPDARLLIAGPVGDPAYADHVVTEIGALGLRNAVDFLGPLAPEELLAQYRSCGVLILPSEQENAPQVIAEAMAAGLPTVATDVGGVPWMITDGHNGYLAPPGDFELLGRRIALLMTDETVWSKMSAAARAEAERFRADRVAALTATLYRELIRTRTLGRGR